MIGRILTTAATEIRIARRNRWVLIAVLLMVVFSLVTTLWPDSVSLQVCLLHKIKEKRVSFFKHVT